MKHAYTDAQLQAAIGGACKEISESPNRPSADALVLTEKGWGHEWLKETPARLDLIKSALAALPEPETFEAHGKTWTKPSVQKPEDDALIEWLLDSELEGRREYQADFVSTTERLGNWGGIVGWRYADEPAPEPLEPEPWTPKVGDVVTLKSGSPDMTVTGIESTVWCCWFFDNKTQSEDFPTACLQPA